MNESKTFEIDFSEAKAIPDLLEQTESVGAIKPNRLHKIWGFNTQAFGDNASGAAALGTLLHHHEIGWSHLPKHQNGRPVNNPYIAEIIRWSSTPDIPHGSLGSSPALILNSLRKASLIANWYAGNTPEKTMQLVAHELDQQRPVIVLVNQKLQGYPLLMEWQVIFQIDRAGVHTKHSTVEDGTHVTPRDAFIEMMLMNNPQLSCSVITACKE
ncbi:MAG: hypothetical protein LW710_01640 [Burkholderiales bacterium]|jgi:hypothetical protein|uniref:hypothetical protein n=1 Tax=Limnobacter sp. TaxID=2003368 RepID=UPI0039377ADD|nr:hypothetical protein [Burkholderiales bacterium]